MNSQNIAGHLPQKGLIESKLVLLVLTYNELNSNEERHNVA